MNRESKFLTQLSMFVLCSIAFLPVVKAEQGDLNRHAQQVTPKRASVSLKQLDEARTWKEWDGALKDMEPVSKENRGVLQSYVDDKKHDGRKRFKVFKTMQDANSIEEKRNAIRGRFANEKDVDFRVSLAQEMGRDKSDFFNVQLLAALNRQDEHPFVKVSAALALAAHGDFSGKAMALKLVKEAAPYKDFAMQTLAVMKATDVIPELSSEMRGATDYWKKNSCRLAILRIEVFSADAAKQISLLSSALAEDGYFEARQWAARKLSEIGSQAAAQALVRVAKDEKSIDKNAALTGLQLGVETQKWTKEEVEKWLKK